MKLVFLLLLLSGAALGQAYTNVTGVAKDSAGNLYANCTFSVQFLGQSSQPGPYLLFGSTFQQSYAGVRCDGFGAFAITLPSNTAIQPQPSSWTFNFCDASGHFCNTQGTGTITIAGATQDITTFLTPLLPVLPPPGALVTSVFRRTGAVVATTGDYSVSQVTGAAPLTSPFFNGIPQTPTASPGTRNNQIASTDFVMTALASGGGGGGWNPPVAPGDTLFGNNTPGTSLPTFFIPGGDTSLSAGNFSVNSLHFGPNRFALTNSGIVTGNCLQVSGSSIIGAPCGTGTGGAVTSVFGRSGIVTAANGDYNFNQIAGTLSSSQIGNAAVASFNGRTGAVTPQIGDYSVGLVSGAAPLASPNFTGNPTGTTQATTDNSINLATTAFVHSVALGGSGGASLPPASISNFTPTCIAANAGGTNTINGTVTANDTVFVFISVYGTATPPAFTVTDLASGGSTYTQLISSSVATSHFSYLFASGVNAAVSATSVTIHWTGTNKYTACVVAYKNVNTLSTPVVFTSATGVTSSTVSLTTQDNNSILLGFIGGASASTATQLSGTLLATATTTVSLATNASMCSNTSAVPASIGCGVTFSANTQYDAFAIELRSVPPVTSVFGRTGAVLATTGDYNFSQIAGTISAAQLGGNAVTSFNGRSGAVTPQAGDYSAFYAPIGVTGNVTSVFGRTGVVSAQSGDYSVAQVTGAAPLISPDFTGTGSIPLAPTAPVGTNTNQIASTAFVLANAGTGGGAVSSVFARTGNVTAQTGDYNVNQVTNAASLVSPIFTGTPTAPTPAPGDSSLNIATTAFVMANGTVGSGTINALAKYSGTTAVGPSGGTEDGNALSYFGPGGIVGSKFSNGSGSGGFQLTSVIAPLPPLPGTGQSALVSGPDGFYVSNANGAYAKLGQAGGATAGVSSFNTRTGTVTSQSGDYSVSQVTGAAPLASPVFTGTPQLATNPPSNDSSQNIPSTSWVTNYVNGATVAQPIGHSAQTSVCASNDVATNAALTFGSPTPLNILAGDTVLMYVTSSNTLSAQATYILTDDGNNTWSTIDFRTQGAAPNMQTATLIGTGASAAKAATTITLTQSVAGKFSACLTTYVGVAVLGSTNKTGSVTGTGQTATLTVVAGGYMFAGAGMAAVATVSWSTGTGLVPAHSTTTGSGANSTSLCENTSATAASVSCTSLWSLSNFNNQIIAVELRPGLTVPPAQPVRINLYKLSVINDVSISSVVQCSTAQCPDGFYFVVILGTVTTVCTTGTAQVNLAYTNEVGPVTTALLLNPMTFTANNVVYAQRPFHHNGTAPMTFSTTGVACTPTAGAGAANLRIAVERLQ